MFRLKSLELRRLCCDFITLFKIMHGITIRDIKNAFVLNPGNIVPYKLVKELC